MELWRTTSGVRGVRNDIRPLRALVRTIAKRVVLRKAPLFFESACLRAPTTPLDAQDQIVGEAEASPGEPWPSDAHEALRRLVPQLGDLGLTVQQQADFAAWLSGLEASQIAEATSRTQNAVDVSISKARGKLETVLETYFGTGS